MGFASRVGLNRYSVLFFIYYIHSANIVILDLGGKSAYFSSNSLHARNQEEDGDNNGIFINDFGRTGGFDFVAKKKTRPLKLRKKYYEFYAAPISKYICHLIAYVAFLATYTYICLVKTPLEPSGQTFSEFGKKIKFYTILPFYFY